MRCRHPDITWLVLILVVCLQSVLHAANIPGRDSPLIDQQAIEAFADDFFTTHMDSLHVPGAVFVVVRDGQIVFSKGYGYANIEDKTQIVPDQTLFRVASVSKLFTATAVMQLYEQGRLDLHEDVNTYLQHFKIPATYPEPVTTAHLLTHTAGFDERLIGIAARSKVGLPTLGDHLAARMPSRVRPVGQIICYSNYGLALAGYIVETISHTPFAQYMDEHILQPLQMRRSSFESPADLVKDLATAYSYTEGKQESVLLDYFLIPPVAQLTATATDMTHFMIAHLQDGRYKDALIINEATAEKMHQRQFTHHPQLPGWCYGFYERFTNGRRSIEHGGAWVFFSYVLLLPDEHTGFFVSQNGGQELAKPLIPAFMDRFFPDTHQIPHGPAQTSSSKQLRALKGHFRYNRRPLTTVDKLGTLLGARELEISLDEAGLLLVEEHGDFLRLDTVRFEEVEPLLFREIDGGRHIAFRRNEQGIVTHLLTDAHMYPVAYDKLSWYDQRRLHLAFLAFCVLVFLSACVTWPVSRLIRRWKKDSAVTHHPGKVHRWSRQARLWAWVTCFLELVCLTALVLYLYVSPPAMMYGELGGIPFLLVLPLITTGFTVCLVVFVALSWREKYWSLFGRIHYTLVVGAAVAFIAFLSYWNLLGFNY